MPVYKDEKRKTWYCTFYITDWQGKQIRKKKRGFKTKREALEWENQQRYSSSGDLNVRLEEFVEVYFRDKKHELKKRTIKNKRHMINCHLLPYLGNRPINQITPSDIIQWQNTIREKGYKPTYLRMIQNQLTALFTHATKIYGLVDNPCKKVKKMGKSDAQELNFWTKEEYDTFIASVDVNDRYYVMFEILFWTGIREGELLALTLGDVDFMNGRLRINKTYYRLNKQDIITEPKTETSIRTIELSEFLVEEIKEYTKRIYDLDEDDRLFPIVPETLQKRLRNQIAEAGVKKIRVHDFRHSHVAFLINQGVQPLLIKNRLGHKDIKITLNTYGHLYPNEQKKVADMLNGMK